MYVIILDHDQNTFGQETIRKRYIDWYKLVYGIHRRLAEAFLECNKSSRRHHNVASKDFQAICDLEQNFEPKALSWLDKEIVETYNLVQNEKYAIIRRRYRIIVEPFLKYLLSYLFLENS